MAKWWCLLAMEKLNVSAYSGHLQVLTTFLLKEFYIICLNRVVMLRSHHHHFMCSTSPRDLGILYKTLLARKLSKPEDGRYRLKYLVFPLLINTII